MSMHEAEAQRQIQQMVNFILNEARDKAQEIEAKALEDFNVEKLKLVQQKKNQVRQEYQQRAKRMETERAIARSNAINKCRLRKVGARHAVVEEVVAGAVQQLARLSTENRDKYRRLLVDLTTQAALAFLEPELYIRVRPEDEPLAASVITDAQSAYSTIIRNECGENLTVKIHIDKDNFLPAGPAAAAAAGGKRGGNEQQQQHTKTCAGGVVITNLNRKIVVDNTLDTRLKWIVKDCLPAVRNLLFPVQ